MSFGILFQFLLFYLIALVLVACLGLKFSHKNQQIQTTQNTKTTLKKLYKICPCRKAVENGLMSSICIYSAVGAFMLSLIDIAFVKNYALIDFAVLLLSVLCAYLGWILKK